MKSLQEMAKEYLDNVAVLEKRIEELKQEERACRSQQKRIELRRRICRLYQMVNEGRLLAFQMDHYYDKPNEGAIRYVKPKSKPAKRGRVRFSSSGYGAPTPAAAVCKPPTRPAARGLRAYLTGRDGTD